MILGKIAANHPQQLRRRQGEPDDAIDDRRTPKAIMRLATERWGPFTLDVAASQANRQAPDYYDREANGLRKPWSGRVWCNPPFSDIGPWVVRAWHQHTRCERIVMLLPNNRCEQGWWQLHIEPYRDGRSIDGALRTYFLQGRPAFGGSACADGKGNRPPFGVVLAVWMVAHQASTFDGALAAAPIPTA